MKLLLVLSGIWVALLSIGTRADAAKLSVVCNLRRLRRRRHELWFYNTATMHGYREGNGQLVPTQYAICSSAWTAFIQASAKSLCSLSAVSRARPS
jgi:hypothetical protein